MMPRKYKDHAAYRAEQKRLRKERYWREKAELATPAPIERPSRMPAELAKREQLQREIQKIRWLA